VVDLVSVREARARLDALAREHPELCSPDAQARAAAWLQGEAEDDGDENNEDEVEE